MASGEGEGELVGRGRQKGAPGPFSTEGTVKQSYLFHISNDLGSSSLLNASSFSSLSTSSPEVNHVKNGSARRLKKRNRNILDFLALW